MNSVTWWIPPPATTVVNTPRTQVWVCFCLSYKIFLLFLEQSHVQLKMEESWQWTGIIVMTWEEMWQWKKRMKQGHEWVPSGSHCLVVAVKSIDLLQWLCPLFLLVLKGRPGWLAWSCHCWLAHSHWPPALLSFLPSFLAKNNKNEFRVSPTTLENSDYTVRPAEDSDYTVRPAK